MSFTEKFERQPRALIVAEMAATLFVIAAFDFVTDYKIRLGLLYAVPIFVLARFCGKKWGIAAAVSASLIWWYVNWTTGDSILHSSVGGAWETSRHFGFFSVMASVGCVLRTKSDIAMDRIALLKRLRVLGDGIGVSQSCSEGVGLRIMRYPARSIGGEVTVERRNGPGTTVSCTVRTNSQCNEIAAA